MYLFNAQMIMNVEEVILINAVAMCCYDEFYCLKAIKCVFVIIIFNRLEVSGVTSSMAVSQSNQQFKFAEQKNPA